MNESFAINSTFTRACAWVFILDNITDTGSWLVMRRWDVRQQLSFGWEWRSAIIKRDIYLLQSVHWRLAVAANMTPTGRMYRLLTEWRYGRVGTPTSASSAALFWGQSFTCILYIDIRPRSNHLTSMIAGSAATLVSVIMTKTAVIASTCIIRPYLCVASLFQALASNSSR